MNSEDIDQALTRRDYTPPMPAASPLTPLGDALAVDRAALDWARRFNAIDEQGQLWCVRCSERPGQLPHLCCGVCIAAKRRGLPLRNVSHDPERNPL